MRDVWTAFRAWMQNERGYSHETQRCYLGVVQRAHAYLVEQGYPGLPWAKPAELKEYLFSTTPTAGNRNAVRAALVAFYAFTRTAGWRPDDPASGLPRLKVALRLPRPAAEDSVERLLIVARTFGPMVEAMVNLFAYCGIRREELRRLRWIDLDGDVVRVIGKGDKERAVTIPDEAQRALKTWRLASLSADYMFPSNRYPDRPLSKSSLSRIIADLGEAAGLLKLTPHVLRHSYATKLLEESDGDITVVQQALGHSSPTTTAIYAKVNPARLGSFAKGMRYGKSQTTRPEGVQGIEAS